MKIKSLLLTSLLAMSPALKAETVTIFLVDPEDAKLSGLNPADLEPPSDDGLPSSEPVGTPTPGKTASQKLDELIEKIRKEQNKYSDKHKRLAAQVERDQKEFLSLMNDFVNTEFNDNDDDSNPEFVRIRTQIGTLLFKAPTKKDFYERLYLINAVYLNNRNEQKRFESLDKHLHNLSLDLEAKHRRIRTIIMGGTTLIGLGLGGFLSYEASKKILPIVANEGGFSSVAKYMGRASIIIVGAGVGAAAGAYAGFLGGDFIYQNEREFLEPIGEDDLREILDYIDPQSTSTLPKL